VDSSDCKHEIIKCTEVKDFLGFPENQKEFEEDSTYAATAMKSFCNQQQQQRKGGNTNKKQRRKRRNTKKKRNRRSNKKK
jgi:hypothetical protein